MRYHDKLELRTKLECIEFTIKSSTNIGNIGFFDPPLILDLNAAYIER